MSVFEKLQEISASKPYLGFTQLSLGYHRVVNFRKVKNKFENLDGQSAMTVVVELRDEILYLPKYFAEKLTDTNIAELNENIDQNKSVYLYFGGRGKKK